MKKLIALFSLLLTFATFSQEWSGYSIDPKLDIMFVYDKSALQCTEESCITNICWASIVPDGLEKFYPKAIFIGEKYILLLNTPVKVEIFKNKFYKIFYEKTMGGSYFGKISEFDTQSKNEHLEALYKTLF